MSGTARTILLFAAVLLIAGLDLFAGGGGLSLADPVIFTKLRLPRMLTAAFGGACLALAGLQMQSIFRNPLADPHIMGVSAGAGTGAAVATLLVGSSAHALLGGLTIAAAAFAGALLSAALVVMVASRFSSASTVLIFGVMLGFVFSAVTSILEYSAAAENLKLFYSWSAGSFSGNTPMEVSLVAAALLAGTLLAFSQSRGLDLALFGDEYSKLAGTNPASTRGKAILGSCLMTAAVTAFCGPVGFVGIVSPHIARRIFSTSVHRRVIPATIGVGMAVSLVADILSQVFPSPLPVGSTMALIGIPVILFILMKESNA
jgi:ABC-type Fe3+-siderophore transport system, permease component